MKTPCKVQQGHSTCLHSITHTWGAVRDVLEAPVASVWRLKPHTGVNHAVKCCISPGSHLLNVFTGLTFTQNCSQMMESSQGMMLEGRGAAGGQGKSNTPDIRCYAFREMWANSTAAVEFALGPKNENLDPAFWNGMQCIIVKSFERAFQICTGSRLGL